MGLTWIDHDTIEKPIEEIGLGTDEAQNIEFTVETLKPTGHNVTGRKDSKENIAKKVDLHFCMLIVSILSVPDLI